MEKELFSKLQKKVQKKGWPLSSRGGVRALVVEPLRKELFCGFHKSEFMLSSGDIFLGNNSDEICLRFLLLLPTCNTCLHNVESRGCDWPAPLSLSRRYTTPLSGWACPTILLVTFRSTIYLWIQSTCEMDWKKLAYLLSDRLRLYVSRKSCLILYALKSLFKDAQDFFLELWEFI